MSSKKTLGSKNEIIKVEENKGYEERGFGEVPSTLTYAEAVKVGMEDYGLNINQIHFVIYYMSNDSMGSGVDAYCKAYGLNRNSKNDYTNAMSQATNFLKDMKILNFFNYMLDSLYLNDHFVDKQLGFLITQNSDMNAKVQGIREYNKLRNRIENNLNIQIKQSFDYSKLSDEELNQLLLLQEKAKK